MYRKNTSRPFQVFQRIRYDAKVLACERTLSLEHCLHPDSLLFQWLLLSGLRREALHLVLWPGNIVLSWESWQSIENRVVVAVRVTSPPFLKTSRVCCPVKPSTYWPRASKQTRTVKKSADTEIEGYVSHAKMDLINSMVWARMHTNSVYRCQIPWLRFFLIPWFLPYCLSNIGKYPTSIKETSRNHFAKRQNCYNFSTFCFSAAPQLLTSLRIARTPCFPASLARTLRPKAKPKGQAPFWGRRHIE